MSADAAELRRQKILRNSQQRLNLLIGVKNNEEASLNRATLSAESAPPVQKCHQSTSKNANEPNGDDFAEAAVEEIESEGLLGEGAVDSPSSPSIPNKRSDSNALCKFNGYSNLEISVFFALALVTSVLFHLHMSELIYKNALLPFVTFEFIYFSINYKRLPSTSSQYQLFANLLRLCGISQRSLKSLMNFFNVLFIFIDNFVLYILSFLLINIFIHHLNFV